MKEIKLKSGHTVLLDDSDYELVKHLTWRVHISSNGIMYARSGYKKPYYLMHRLIMGVADSKIIIDHKDRNGLNNQRINLRLCSVGQNNLNRIGRGKSKYRGVYLRRDGKKWAAKIKINGQQIHLGAFNKEEDAAEAFNKAAIATGNPFHRLNEINHL